MIYKIVVNEDKTIVCDRDIVVNQFENEIDELVFELPFDDFSYVGVLKTPVNTKLELPIIDNKIVIGSDITSLPGVWSLIVVGQKDEVVFVSNSLALKSCRNHLSLQTMQEMDANIELLYLELQQKIQVLDTLDLDGLETMNTDIQSIKTTVSSILSLSAQMMDAIQYTKTEVGAVNSKVDGLHTKLGDNANKQDGTLFNYSYWGLVRAEEAKTNTETIITLLTDADALADEILTTLSEE